MNTIVCIKQVPDSEHIQEVTINPETNTLERNKIPAVINPFDVNAIEEAIRIKEKHGGKVTIVTMGPPQAEEALRTALAMGADEAILLTDMAFAGSDTWATAKTLAKAVEKIGGFDLVIFGKQAIDGDTAQVGPEVAEALSLPQITYVSKLDVEDKKIKGRRTVEDAYEEVEALMPCIITVTKDINEPRFASIRGILKAKKAEIIKWGKDDLGMSDEETGLNGSATQVVKIFSPPRRGKGEMIEGVSADEKTSNLVEKLRADKII
ncbi:MAG: electron transfer flavoprotein subunit beta/FixA family protein [Candidatus Omnitrophica bacterium]|nr:electron transfer flavoprotein subunit beta/FixA family protein [Candidatus Omnitrophota bacterium]MBU1047877.1 electron transfer flavoprotein subunit beta/FixA family protein [Candidatus Omnitrophota bacterium]MBU1630589.1 electron transfer flavoprotein subunit beta/FixA family protein [Candidatus Omnitrophota bacterium]MBU1888500.1 electron transfer flavoprotein subunit beta/FixA family protein [Candidatus Omnitrophota bacterium]